MRRSTFLLITAITVFAIPAKAQMTLPQIRMVEAQRDVEALNRGMQAAKETTKKQQEEEAQAHHMSYSWIALSVIALWLYGRSRRVRAGQPGAKSGV